MPINENPSSAGVRCGRPWFKQFSYGDRSRRRRSHADHRPPETAGSPPMDWMKIPCSAKRRSPAGLIACRCLPNACRVFLPPASASSGHTLRRAANAAEFLKRAEKVIPYPIEIISGNEEARLIFMGVEHTQPERGRKLVIDIGGGSTELVIGEDFEPRLVESRRMGCVSFSQIYFPAAPSTKRISSARVCRPCRSWKRWRGSSASRAGMWRWRLRHH